MQEFTQFNQYKVVGIIGSVSVKCCVVYATRILVNANDILHAIFMYLVVPGWEAR